MHGRVIPSTRQFGSTFLRLKCCLLVLAAVIHTPQFNGKQEGKPMMAALTCAAPATVSE